MSTVPSEVAQVRKALPLGIPSVVLMLFGGWYITSKTLVAAVQDLLSLAPSIRITPGAVVGPFLIPMALMLIIMVPMKAIPVFPSFAKKLEIPFTVLVLVSFLVMVLTLTTAPFLQNHYMPKLGYSKCNELQGHPTMWFTTWVKNPAWCVRGMTREWVNEQAKLAQAASAAR